LASPRAPQLGELDLEILIGLAVRWHGAEHELELGATPIDGGQAGLELFMPMNAKQRRIAGRGPFLLVPKIKDEGAKLLPLSIVTKRCGI
jgi:hypothetical protein